MERKSFLTWLFLIPLAILNGLFRDKVLAPLLGVTWALPISGILLCSLVIPLPTPSCRDWAKEHREHTGSSDCYGLP